MRDPETSRIVEEGSPLRYFTAVPNTVIRGLRGKTLSVYAKWLYVYLKSVAGDTGTCWQSTETMAQGAAISTGKVSQAKAELVQVRLIRIKPGNHAKHETDEIRILDIWHENMQEFRDVSGSPHEGDEEPSPIYGTPENPLRVHHMKATGGKPGSPHEGRPSPHEGHNPKKIPLKKIPKNKTMSSRRSDVDGFETFWTTWGASKRKDKKQQCLALWSRRNLGTRLEELCATVLSWHQTEKWLAGFEPSPYTWLKGYEYDDEVPAPRQQPTAVVPCAHKAVVSDNDGTRQCVACKQRFPATTLGGQRP